MREQISRLKWPIRSLRTMSDMDDRRSILGFGLELAAIQADVRKAARTCRTLFNKILNEPVSLREGQQSPEGIEGRSDPARARHRRDEGRRMRHVATLFRIAEQMRANSRSLAGKSYDQYHPHHIDAPIAQHRPERAVACFQRAQQGLSVCAQATQLRKKPMQ